MVFAAVFYLTQIYETKNMIENERIRMNNLYGVNQDITGTGYDRNLGTVCDNGTFVGKEENGVLSCKGIPYAEQPVGDLRWKPPVDARAQDGVYEAYYFGKSGIQTEAESERASFYPKGEDIIPQKNNIIVKENKTMKDLLKIEGMMCPHCEARVKNALEALPEVDSALVSHESGTAEVTLNAGIPHEALAAAVTAQGYEVIE